MTGERIPAVEEMELICETILIHPMLSGVFCVAHQKDMLFFLTKDGKAWAAKQASVDDQHVILTDVRKEGVVRIRFERRALLPERPGPGSPSS